MILRKTVFPSCFPFLLSLRNADMIMGAIPAIWAHKEQEMGWERKKKGTGNPISVCEDADSCEEMQGGLGSKG